MADLVADLAWTRQWIGLPFRDRARGPDAFDCWGLLWAVLREEFGVEIPSYAEVSGETANRDQVRELFSKPEEVERWKEVPAGQEQPGDGILIRMRGQPWHVAVVAGEGLMLHVIVGANTCLESYRSSKWRRRILGFYRWRGA